MPKRTVMIIDDHPLFREGLKAIINRNEKYVLISEAGNSAQAIDLALLHAPDIIIVEIAMPSKNGIQIIRELHHALSNTQFITMSKHAKSDSIIDSFHAGALGYISKTDAPTHLAQALDKVSKRNSYLPDEVSTKVLSKILHPNSVNSNSSENPYLSLTAREREIMHMLIDGFSSKEIATKLFISLKTVENHRCNFMNKLNLKDSIDLIRYAARTKLIDLETWAN